MNSSLSDLKYFSEVATMLNITKAAQKLGIRQSSLSQAIQRIEKFVDAPLLMRSKSGVHLTKAGEIFLVRSKELLQKWDEVRNSARVHDREVMGHYSIGCHAALAIYILPSFLPGLFRRFPKIHVELSHNISRKITDEVASFRLDFGIVADPISHPDLVIRRLGSDEAGFFIRAGATPLDPFQPEDRVLICDPDLSQTQYLSRELEKTRSRFKRYLYTTRLDVITTLVGAGAGVGILPRKATTHFAAQKLRMIPSLPKMKNSICLIYRRDALKAPAFLEVARYIESQSKWSAS